jgi:CRISPR/Cas system-associated protein Cas7 (RAMP superfamily)
MVVHTCHLSCTGSINRRIDVQISLGKEVRPCSKNKNKAKRAGGVIKAVEHLLSKCKALSSNPSTTKKKKE